jgi:hypothetical protein
MVFQKILLALTWCCSTNCLNCNTRKNGYNQILDKKNKKKANKMKSGFKTKIGEKNAK